MKKIDRTTAKVIRCAIPLCLSFLVAFGVLFVAVLQPSLGWFSFNRKTGVSGAGVRVQNDQLIVATTESDVLAATAAEGDTLVSVTFPATGAEYVPATHDGNYTNYPTGLKYVSEESFIGFYSGVGTEPPEFLSAANTQSRVFYRDVDVYIARVGEPMTNATLTASLAASKLVAGVPTAVSGGSLMATSVDFYRNSVSGSNYVGTLNVAGYDPAENDYTTRKTSQYLVGSDSTTGTIPNNAAAAGDRYLHYVLRCYFDGALLSGEDQAYVFSADLDVSAVTLTVVFTADN